MSQQKEIDELARQIRYHDDLYWEKNIIEIPDADYDKLRAQLKALDPKHELLHEVAEKLKENELTVPHAVPMLSIEKCFTPPEVEAWATEAGAFQGDSKSDGLVACYKVDGSSCSLIYEDGVFIQAATRGNGREGNLITRNALQVGELPHRLNIEHKGRFEVRGEIYMSRASFNKAVEHFERLLAEGKAKEDERPPNARNYCAGTLMLKDPREVKRRELSFLAHGCIGKIPGSDSASEASNFKALEALGFVTPFYKHVTKPAEIAEVTAAIDAQRDSLPYDTDGVVFTINRLSLHAELGTTSHHPRYRIAFKYGREQGVTTINGFLWDTSRSGRVCPTIVVEPIHLGGATVRLCTAHNAKRVIETGIGIGDKVLLEREVIPYLVKKVEGPDHGKSSVPKACASCGAELVWDETETNLMCPNFGGCKSQLQDYLEHYVGRHAANIDGIGEKIIEKLLEKGLLKSPADFYTLSAETLLEIAKDPTARKSKTKGDALKFEKKLVENIQKARSQTFDSFLITLGIKGLGPSVAAKLARHFGTLDALRSATRDDLQKIEGIAETMAEAIAKGLHDRQDLIAALVPHLTIKETPKIEGHLSGKSFCITGHVEFDFDGTHYDSRDAIEALIQSKGGTIKAVSKKLDYLVAGAGGGGKREKAEKAGVKIIDGEALREILKG